MLYDISPLVSPDLAVWPGDTPPTRQILSDMRRGANLTLSTLQATVHLGSHADAPSHYGRDAASIERLPLDRFLGPCQVVPVEARPGSRFGWDALLAEVVSTRVLLVTGTYPDPRRFREDFAAPEPALVGWLAARGVQLIGIDTPSVDLFTSKELPTHRACLQHDISILEGLVLNQVPPGRYELVALPLRLKGFDASPIRAVLRSLTDNVTNQEPTRSP
jgi:arylformamidase